MWYLSAVFVGPWLFGINTLSFLLLTVSFIRLCVLFRSMFSKRPAPVDSNDSDTANPTSGVNPQPTKASPKSASRDALPGSPSKRVKTNSASVSNRVPSNPVSRPALRSVPVPTKVKSEAIPVSAATTEKVVDLDADWSSTVPPDFSKSIESVLSRVASPPNDLSPDIIELDSELESSAGAAFTPHPATSETKLSMVDLQSVWSTCERPIQRVTRSFLMAEGHLNRVDILLFRAMEQRSGNDVKDVDWSQKAYERFAEIHKGFFRVPLSVRCDRSFFERADDALYIDLMSKFFADDATTTPPVLSDPRLYKVFVTEDRTRALQHKLMWAVVVMRKKILTHEDFFVVRRAHIDVNKATVPLKEEESILALPWDMLPSIPAWMEEILDLRSAPVAPVRALIFFASTARAQGADTYKKWNKALQFELAMHMAVAHYSAWARPVIDQTRLWYPSEAHVKWLKEFNTLPPIPVFFETLGKFVKVSIADVVRILEEARARATPVKRRDYCTKTNVEFIVTPNSHIYVNDPLREAVLRPNAQPVLGPVLSQPSTNPAPIKSNGPGNRSIPTNAGARLGTATKMFKRDHLKKGTTATADMLEGLKGSGPFSMAEVVNFFVEENQRIVKSNDALMTEATQLREEARRLRDDIMRYREDASRLSTELRSLRDQPRQDAYNPYDSRSRGWTDPYDRSYGYDRRY